MESKKKALLCAFEGPKLLLESDFRVIGYRVSPSHFNTYIYKEIDSKEKYSFLLPADDMSGFL